MLFPAGLEPGRMKPSAPRNHLWPAHGVQEGSPPPEPREVILAQSNYTAGSKRMRLIIPRETWAEKCRDFSKMGDISLQMAGPKALWKEIWMLGSCLSGTQIQAVP